MTTCKGRNNVNEIKSMREYASTYKSMNKQNV